MHAHRQLYVGVCANSQLFLELRGSMRLCAPLMKLSRGLIKTDPTTRSNTCSRALGATTQHVHGCGVSPADDRDSRMNFSRHVLPLNQRLSHGPGPFNAVAHKQANKIERRTIKLVSIFPSPIFC
jgi:hypothetical protein